MKCQNCGAKIKDRSEYCNKCGAKQVIDEIHSIPNITPNPIKNILAKLSKKNKIIFSICGIVFVAVITIIIFQISNPINQITREMNGNNYTQAMIVYNNKIKGNSQAEKQIKEKLITDAKDLYANYKNGKVDYTTAFKKLGEIKNTSLVDSDISSIISDTNNLNDSQLAYKKGIEFKSSKNYLDALIEFNKVIEVDTNYNKSRDEIKNISTTYKQDILSQIEESANKQDYEKVLQLISEALKALPNDTDLLAKQTNYQKLNEEKIVQDRKEKIKTLINQQQLTVTSAKILVQDSEYKSLYPDMMQVIVKNISNKTVKSYEMGLLAYDSNGLPIKIKREISISEDYEFVGNANDANILPNKSYGSENGWNLDSQHGISKIIACTKSVTYYDGSTWDNEYYDYWIDEYKNKPMH